MAYFTLECTYLLLSVDSAKYLYVHENVLISALVLLSFKNHEATMFLHIYSSLAWFSYFQE